MKDVRREIFTDHDPVSGTVFYALLLLFALMPGLVWRSTDRREGAQRAARFLIGLAGLGV